MVRTLSIGHEVDFTTHSVDWETDVLFQDYELVFVDLLTLDEMVGEESIRDTEGVAYSPLPNQRDVATHLRQGHDVVVVLPTRQRIPQSGGSSGSRIDLFRWIPGRVEVAEEVGNSLRSDSIREDWEWYFGGQNFEWVLYFEDLTIGGTGLRDSINSLISNIFDRAVACELDYQDHSENTYTEVNGSVYLIPLLDSYSYEDLLKGVLRYNFGEETETPNERDIPDWVDSYSVPGESTVASEIENIEHRIDNLTTELDEKEEQFENLQRYKGLLYGNEAFLENLVPTVLREVGFEVEGEVPHNRDGLISLDDRDIVLEIHGTTNGIPQSKCRQLRDWVNDYQDENPSTRVDGILIVNPLRNQPLDGRNGALTPHTEDYMENLGYRFMRTEDVYKMLIGSMTDQLTFKEIRQKFLKDGLHLTFDIDI